MGVFKNNMKINQINHKKYLDNTDAHFLNRNYGRTGHADEQTDQQHSTSCVICWLTVAWAARCCAMLHSWFNFRIFIEVSNQIFLEFLFEFQSCSSIKLFDYRGSTVYYLNQEI